MDTWHWVMYGAGIFLWGVVGFLWGFKRGHRRGVRDQITRANELFPYKLEKLAVDSLWRAFNKPTDPERADRCRKVRERLLGGKYPIWEPDDATT